MTRAYEPPDPQQTPVFEPPARLVEGWQNYGRLAQQVPARILDRLAVTARPTLFGYQFVCHCESLATRSEQQV